MEDTTKNQPDNAPNKASQIHKCSLCDYVATRKYNLTRHMKNTHGCTSQKTNSNDDTVNTLNTQNTSQHHMNDPQHNDVSVSSSSSPSKVVLLEPTERGKNWFMPYLSCIGRYDHNDIIVAVYEDLQKRQHTFTKEVDPEYNLLEQIMGALSNILKEIRENKDHEPVPQYNLAHDIFLIIGALLLCKPCLIRKSEDAYKECIIFASMAMRVLGYNIVVDEDDNDDDNSSEQSTSKDHCGHTGCSGCHS